MPFLPWVGMGLSIVFVIVVVVSFALHYFPAFYVSSFYPRRRVMTSIFFLCSVVVHSVCSVLCVAFKGQAKGLEVIYYHDSRSHSFIAAFFVYIMNMNSNREKKREKYPSTFSTKIHILSAYELKTTRKTNKMNIQQRRPRQQQTRPEQNSTSTKSKTRKKNNKPELYAASMIMCVRAFVYLCRNGRKKPLLCCLVIS